ncbi:hypothetical protein [Haloechinothrix halophila]|uniref:hypothetical protein n=1 Tax=Haloechinothrix halophila TaxID=1069073 RepID=UPI0004080BCB|nr:hypothetical protein [Haloechinothrix halophila]
MVRSRAIGAVLTTTALAGLLQLATTLGAAPALACSCTPMTDAEYVGNADVIFAGTLLDREEPPSGQIVSSRDLVTLTFAVSEVYKGQVGAMTQVRTASSGASCGLEIEGEGPFLVFTTFDENGLTASLCGGTRDLPETVPAVLGEGRPPAGSGGTEKMAHDQANGTQIDSGTETSWWWAVGSVAALGIAGALGVWLKRRTSRD